MTIRGLRARGCRLVDAASVTNDGPVHPSSDTGPPAGPGRTTTETTLTGSIAMVLPDGKRGEVNGALLDNGTILRLPPPEAERMQAFLQVRPSRWQCAAPVW